MAKDMLSGKRGVILGVANERSIAWGCAKACHEQGAELRFNFLGEAQEKRVRKLLEQVSGSDCYPCDVSDDASIGGFFKAIGDDWDGFDFLIHSVAYANKDNLRDPFLETSREDFKLALDISAYSLVGVTRAAAPMLREGGNVLCMTYYGAEKTIPYYNVMGVAKAALEACVRYLAVDLGNRGVRVNAISAGPIRTLSASAIPSIKLLLKIAEEASPLRRNVTAEEVGATAAFLASDLASGITGEVLHVDAGYNILGAYKAADAEDRNG